MRHRTAFSGVRRAATLTVVALIGSLTVGPVSAAVAPGTLTTFAGGVGWGLGTDVAQAPVKVGIVGNRVLSVDGPSLANELPALDEPYPSTVRAVDPATGQQSVVAGNGAGRFNGDGGPAVLASVGNAADAVGDAAGNVYIADAFNARIRKVSPSGVITTIAGTGEPGFSGDGGPATEARLRGPGAMVIAPDGALIFSDGSNFRLRRIGADGIISTIAGTGTFGTAGDGGPALLAQMAYGNALAFDGAGTLYIADLTTDRVRAISPLGVITTFAQASFPRGMAVMPDGRVLVTLGSTIQSIDAAGARATVAGRAGEPGGFGGDGGPATEALLNDPRSVAVDAGGNVYVADAHNRRVRRIDTSGVITTVAGNGLRTYSGDGGAAVAAKLGSLPLVRAAPNGLYILDRTNHRLRHVDGAGVITTLRETDAQNLAVDRASNVYLSEGYRVVKRTPSGTETVVAGNGELGPVVEGVPATATSVSPTSLTVDGRGNLYIYDLRSNEAYIRRIDPAGIITNVAGRPHSEDGWHDGYLPDLARGLPLSAPHMAVGEDGALYLNSGRQLYRIRCGIADIHRLTNSIDSGEGLAVDRGGNLFLAAKGKVHRVSPAGVVTTVAGGGTQRNQESIPATSAQLGRTGHDVTLDDAGNLYVTDDDRVLRVAGASAGAAQPTGSCHTPPDRPVWGWGWNGLGALGDASSPGRTHPASTDDPPLTGATAVAGGAFHSLALKADGTVWAWGWNAYGQLGDGTTVSHAQPTRVAGLSGVTAVSAGWLHNLAVTRDGSVWAWGWNGVGQLGDGTTATSLTPKRVGSLSGATAVSAGVYGSFAVRSDGTLWAWGWNGFGQLGDGSTDIRLLPVRVPGLSGVRSVSAGLYHTLALRVGGGVSAWGWNGLGQLGDGTKVDRHTPVAVPVTGATGIAAGAYHSLALTSGHTLSAWGWNDFGQLGDHTTTSSATPVNLPLPNVRAIAAGLAHTVAILGDGTLYAWGWNGLGQLGTTTPAEMLPPWTATAIPRATAIAAGAGHSLAVFDLSGES